MKRYTFLTFTLTALLALVGCEKAKEAAEDAKDKANDAAENAKDKAKEVADKAKDAAKEGLGDFDLKGLQEKFTGITDGFKNVSADNVDGLTSKISGLTGSLDSMGIDKLSGPAKGMVGKAISGFMEKIKSAMGGIKDEGILGKLKPVVEPLMKKLGGLTGS